MRDLEESAEERLQRQALENARALVDKLERGDDRDGGLSSTVIGGIVALVVVVGGSFVFPTESPTSRSKSLHSTAGSTEASPVS